MQDWSRTFKRRKKCLCDELTCVQASRVNILEFKEKQGDNSSDSANWVAEVVIRFSAIQEPQVHS